MQSAVAGPYARRSQPVIPPGGASATFLTATLLSALCIAYLTGGCFRNAGSSAGSAAPASQPTVGAGALLTLDELTPMVKKPANPVGWDKLPGRAEADVTAAEADIKRSDYVEAIERLERARGFDQDNARIRRDLGLAYAKLRNDGRALEHLRVAGRGAPDDLEVQVLLGRLYGAQKQYDKAVLAYRTALKCSQADDRSPLVGEALLRLGQLLVASGRHTAALQCYSRLQRNISRYGREYASRDALRAVVLRPEQLLSRRGELYLRLDKPAKAAELLERSYRRYRTNVNTSRLLLRALVAVKRFKQAETILREIVVEPVLKPLAAEMATMLCAAAKDEALPARLWKAYRAGGRLDGKLAVVLARSARKLGAAADAAAILESVLAAMPNNVPVGRFLARLRMEQGDYDGALVLLAGLVDAGAGSRQALFASLKEMASHELPATFERDFAARIESEKTSPRHVLLYVAAALARIRGKGDTAAGLLRKSLAAKAGFLPAVEMLAGVYIGRKNYAGVELLLASLAGTADGKSLTHLVRGRLFLARGQPKKAAEELENALSRRSDLPTMLLLARAYGQAGHIGAAARVLRPAMREYAGNVELHKQLFRLYMRAMSRTETRRLRQQYLRQAEPVVRLLLDRRPDSPQGRIMQAELFLAQGKTDLAEKTLKDLHARMPASAAVRLLSVRIEMAGAKGATEAGRTALISRLRDVLKLEPDNIEAATILAALLDRAGGDAEIVALWRGLYKRNAGDVRVAVPFAQSLFKAGRIARAAEVLEKVVRNDPSNSVLRLRLVELLLEMGEHARAAEQGTRGLAALSDLRKAFEYRGRLMRLYESAKAFDQGQALLDDWILTTGSDEMILALKAAKVQLYADAEQFGRAEQYTASWLKQSPQLLAPRVALIGALSHAKQFDRAHKILAAWLRKAGASATMQTTQPARADMVVKFCREMDVRLLVIQNKCAEALARLEPMLRSNPKDTALLTLKSSCLSELNRGAEAMAVLETALAIEPDSASLNNNLGYMYADLGINLNKAERMIRKALAERTDEMSFMDSLAWVFYKQGRLDEASRKFDQIFACKKLKEYDHPVIYDHAGDTYYRLGLKDKAVRMWKRALERADKETVATIELRRVRLMTPKKIKAVAASVAAPVEPLGKGVKAPTTAPSGPVR